MTLILSLMTPTKAVLVADRRFTSGGKVFDDERTKTSLIACRDARALVAFTGLAKVEKFESSRTILRALSEVLKPDHLLRLKLQSFAGLMSNEIRKLRIPANQKHLTIVLAGYYYYGPAPLPFLCQVTNATNGWDKDATEEMKPFWSKQPLGLYGFGVRAGVAAKDRATLHQLLVEDRPAIALVQKAVHTIQAASDSPKSRRLVGKQCNSVILPVEPREGILAEYHSLFQPAEYIPRHM